MLQLLPICGLQHILNCSSLAVHNFEERQDFLRFLQVWLGCNDSEPCIKNMILGLDLLKIGIDQLIHGHIFAVFVRFGRGNNERVEKWSVESFETGNF